jgi:pimeloyl-ACP methyl ester carboxylesterase
MQTFKCQVSAACLLFLLATTVSCFSGVRDHDGFRDRWKERRQRADVVCDRFIPEIKKGYGAEGPYEMDIKTVANPLWDGAQVSVFFPRGFAGRLPVIFFSHAFGASDWELVYPAFIKHMVSQGYIVVFSPYQTIGAGFDGRYATLWKGFENAARQFVDQMDLTRVGFVGHSFGGGATPAMAYNGIINQGWGKNGAFLYILAPWYSFQINSAQMREFPNHVVLLMQVYDRDHINDHRMAIDIYRSIMLPDHQKHFQIIHSEIINGCELVADHASPARNPSLRLKQYAVFRPFDAVADYVFGDSGEENQFLSQAILSAAEGQYQPIRAIRNPEPRAEEKRYLFPWSSDKNPRRSMTRW